MMKRTAQAKHEGVFSFKSRVLKWAERIRVKPVQVRVQSMSRKWASCSTKGWLSFSDDLLLEPTPFQDYVIVHELLHLKVTNHGKLFKSYLTAYLPNWRKYAPLPCRF
jgi:hypothetical protein